MGFAVFIYLLVWLFEPVLIHQHLEGFHARQNCFRLEILSSENSILKKEILFLFASRVKLLQGFAVWNVIYEAEQQQRRLKVQGVTGVRVTVLQIIKH